MAADPISRLERAWWFSGLRGFRPAPDRGTYFRFDLEAQPAVAHLYEPGFAWLEELPDPPEWALTQDDEGDHTRVQSIDRLAEILGSRSIDPALETFIRRPDLQRKLRSCTGSYLDLGDFVVPIEGDSGAFVHVVSDQQWVMHWLVQTGGPTASGVVVATYLPYGFETDGWYEEPVPRSVGPGEMHTLEICADSFEEFVFRWWVENELFFSAADNQPLTHPATVAYAEMLTAGRNSS